MSRRLRHSKTYYSLDRMDRYDDSVKYRVTIGQRSNGKTYAVKCRIIDRLAEDKTFQFAYIRRLQTHVAESRMKKLFADVQWYAKERLGDTISYSVNDGFYLTNDKKKHPLGFKFSIEKSEIDRGISFPGVRLVFFDEFMSKDGYFGNEIDRFVSILSTIIRGRDNVDIYMIANTVNEICPYLDWLKCPVRKLKQGYITYIEHRGGVKVAVEWCRQTDVIKKEASKYFGVDDDNTTVMTMTGGWETQNLTTKEIDGVKWNYKDRELIPVYITGNGYVFELSITQNLEYPIVFIRSVNTQNGIVNERIQINLSLDDMSITNKNGAVPRFGAISKLCGDGFINLMKTVDNCIRCGRVLYTDALDGTRFLNIYNEIIKR